MSIFKRVAPYLTAGLSLAVLAACKPSEEINPYRQRLTATVIVNQMNEKKEVRDRCPGLRLPVSEETANGLVGGTVFSLGGWGYVNDGVPTHLEFRAYKPGAGEGQETGNAYVYLDGHVSPEDLPPDFREPSYPDGVNLIIDRIKGSCGDDSGNTVPVESVAAGTIREITIRAKK
ncbi:MAG: hypothetical protein HY516_01595 [Candidatus Aenigmarchaeota archaeon]|nr:hypothetical protein [Candidatus Aenigmarchaeota archaeon]